MHMTAVFLAAADRARGRPLPRRARSTAAASPGGSACCSGSSSGSRPRCCSRRRSRSPWRLVLAYRARCRRRGRACAPAGRPLLGAAGIAARRRRPARLLRRDRLPVGLDQRAGDLRRRPAELRPPDPLDLGRRRRPSLTSRSHFRGNDCRAGRLPRHPDARDRRLVRAPAPAGRPSPGSCSPRSSSRSSSRSGPGSSSRARSWSGCPGTELARLPLFNNVLPVAARALRLARRRRDRRALDGRAGTAGSRWLLPALAVAALVPDLWQARTGRCTPSAGRSSPRRRYKICFPKNENVAIFPFGCMGRLDALAGRVRLLVPHARGLPRADAAGRRTSRATP